MATNKQLEDKIDRLEAVVELLTGKKPPRSKDPKDSPNYVEFGGEKHVIMLGLVVVPEDEIEEAKADKYILMKSRDTGTTYRLDDEITILRYYPGIDPEKAAMIVLRQKVGVLESGPPPIPENAPTLWRPAPVY